MKLRSSNEMRAVVKFSTLIWSFVTWATVMPAQAPRIDKIDPPGWWTQMPDPMLLVYGEHLSGANFSIAGNGVQLTRSQTSDNGHWAFLWLRTSRASAQTVTIGARNTAGIARQPFDLATRSTDVRAHLGFSAADVMYLIMTDRFARGQGENDKQDRDRNDPRGWHGGDFKGIEQHLDYLRDLGVTTMWTTPVASNGAMPDSYHGYAATDLYAVDSHFGTVADYRRLADALHARGMKLVIDLVPNHLGVQHPWVLDPPAPEWFHGTLAHHIGAQGDFYQLVDPHASKQSWRALTTGWFTDAMPDLNQENPLVSAYLIENALWWVETAKLDGIRLDTFPYVGRAFWHDFHTALHTTFPQVTTVGEVFNGDAELTSFFAGGVSHDSIDTGLDTPFDFPVFFALRNVLAGNKPMTELASVLRKDALYPHPERLVTFAGNHDTMRFFTAANKSASKLKLAMGLIATMRGMPEIYSGDEIAMEGGDDPDNRHDFPGGFPGDERSAFNAKDRTPVEQDAFAWTAGMLALRRSHSVMRGGYEQNLLATDDVFAFVRADGEAGCGLDHARERVLVVMNKATQSHDVKLNTEGTVLSGCTEFEPMAPALGAVPKLDGGMVQLEEAGESMSLYRVR